MKKEEKINRLYCSSFNHLGWKSNQARKARAHSLRVKNILENLPKKKVRLEDICSPDKIKNNLIYYTADDGSLKKLIVIDQAQLERVFNTITNRLKTEKKEYIESLENAYSNSNKAELSSLRANAKAALKRYHKGCEAEEQNFWANLSERLGTTQIDPQAEIEKLQSFGKVKRYNQKIKRLKDLEQFNALLDVRRRNTEYTVFSKETLFKITDDSAFSLTPEDWVEFVRDYNKRMFPDFQMTYMTVHLDENEEQPHVHCEYSGRNRKTGAMDIQTQLFLRVEEECKKRNKPFPFSGRSYNDLDNKADNREIAVFGEIYQELIFEDLNNFLNKKEYKHIVTPRTPEEKAADKRKFENTISTQDREGTRANKLAENNKILKAIQDKKVQKIKDQNKDIVLNDNILLEQQDEIDDNKYKINSDKVKIEIQEKAINENNNKINFSQTMLTSLLTAYSELKFEMREWVISFMDGVFNKNKAQFDKAIEIHDNIEVKNPEAAKDIDKQVNAINSDITEPYKKERRKRKQGKGMKI